ncbi:hypothetical protein PhaeoP128_00184 [Phaeobacter gallaeciensis]|nr:hypothetical protein PhaeoP129_00184 [Phaeobacter gallaeciensis]ATF20963.1 hypothetical protein PhaeoP128_00184 [Phaeobacter gallaeciensis]
MRNHPHGRNTLVEGDPWQRQGPEDCSGSRIWAMRYAFGRNESTRTAWPGRDGSLPCAERNG